MTLTIATHVLALTVGSMLGMLVMALCAAGPNADMRQTIGRLRRHVECQDETITLLAGERDRLLRQRMDNR